MLPNQGTLNPTLAGYLLEAITEEPVCISRHPCHYDVSVLELTGQSTELRQLWAQGRGFRKAREGELLYKSIQKLGINKVMLQ